MITLTWQASHWEDISLSNLGECLDKANMTPFWLASVPAILVSWKSHVMCCRVSKYITYRSHISSVARLGWGRVLHPQCMLCPGNLLSTKIYFFPLVYFCIELWVVAPEKVAMPMFAMSPNITPYKGARESALHMFLSQWYTRDE